MCGSSFCDREGCRSFERVFDSIWRILSRLTLNSRPTSAKVRGWPSSNPNHNLDELAFPVGHCGHVGLSGFLLSGGLGWNSGHWGPACLSIRGLEVVTADGR
jgi:FAD/FMN-containing dehydrogenase